MPPLRVTFISRAHTPHAGGMERLNYELVSQLKNLPDVNVGTIVYHGPRILSPLFLFTGIFKSLSAARQSDIVHLGDPTLSFLGYLIKKLTGKPVAVTVHGLDISYPLPLYQFYLRLFFTRFDLYLPISRHVNQILQSKNISPASKIIVIKPGLNDQYFSSRVKRRHLDQLLSLDTANKFIIITVGRLIKRKGHAWFIANILPKLPSHVLYVIAGAGPETDNIQHTAVQHGLGDQLIQLGRVSAANLEVLYNTADAFVQPNIHIKNDHEGYGLVLVEAALCGLPVFASKMEGMTDAIHNGQNGILLPPENPAPWITQLTNLTATPLSSEKSLQIRDYTKQHHTWPHLISKYKKAFKKTAGKNLSLT